MSSRPLSDIGEARRLQGPHSAIVAAAMANLVLRLDKGILRDGTVDATRKCAACKRDLGEADHEGDKSAVRNGSIVPEELHRHEFVGEPVLAKVLPQT